VQINPFQRHETPKTAREILDRINEISFNASLVQELAHVDFVNQCLGDGSLSGKAYREIYVHRVGGGPVFEQLSASSKLNAEMAFLTYLRTLGYEQMSQWLDENFDAIGRRGTLDLAQFRTNRLARAAAPHPIAANDPR
jgi:NTE family protein